MLSTATATDVRSFARLYAEEAAGRFLATAALLQAQVSPPKGPKELAAWQARQRYLCAELHLAAAELERFLRLERLASEADGEPP